MEKGKYFWYVSHMKAIDEFKKLLKTELASGKSLNQIALASGADGASLNKWLNGKQKTLNFDTVAKVLDYLGAGIGESKKAPTIQYVGGDAPGIPSEGEEVLPIHVYAVAGAGPAWDVLEKTPIFSITAPPSFASQSYFALLVDGESMYPTIKNGAVVGVSQDARFRQNEIFAVHIPYEGLAIKRVAIDHSNSQYVLRSDNPDKSKYDDIRIFVEEAPSLIIGRVVWVWQAA